MTSALTMDLDASHMIQKTFEKYCRFTYLKQSFVWFPSLICTNTDALVGLEPLFTLIWLLVSNQGCTYCIVDLIWVIILHCMYFFLTAFVFVFFPIFTHKHKHKGQTSTYAYPQTTHIHILIHGQTCTHVHTRTDPIITQFNSHHF